MTEYFSSHSVVEQWTNSTVRITTKVKNDDDFYGTCFLFGKSIDDKHISAYLVTNRHLVENQNEGTLHMHSEVNGKLDPTNPIYIYTCL